MFGRFLLREYYTMLGTSCSLFKVKQLASLWKFVTRLREFILQAQILKSVCLWQDFALSLAEPNNNIIVTYLSPLTLTKTATTKTDSFEVCFSVFIDKEKRKKRSLFSVWLLSHWITWWIPDQIESSCVCVVACSVETNLNWMFTFL